MSNENGLPNELLELASGIAEIIKEIDKESVPAKKEASGDVQQRRF